MDCSSKCKMIMHLDSSYVKGIIIYLSSKVFERKKIGPDFGLDLLKEKDPAARRVFSFASDLILAGVSRVWSG